MGPLRSAVSHLLKRVSRAEVVLALHHVKEDGDGGLPEVWFWHQRGLQDGPHHGWDEFHLVWP